MTGFGRGCAPLGGHTVTVEISTVNRKQFDASIRVPAEWHCFEVALLATLKSSIARGAVKCTVSLALAGVKSPALEALNILRAVARAENIPDTPTLADLVALTTAGVSQPLPEADEVAKQAVLNAAQEALVQLDAMRLHEGELIATDIRERLQRLAQMQDEIEEIAPDLPGIYRDALQMRVKALLSQATELPVEVLAREVALFAERCDIAEEMTRLRAHFVHAEKLLSGDGPCGRALDFLCQEFMREINTTGSKCNNSDIAQRVITFKTLLETVREQVQNLE